LPSQEPPNEKNERKVAYFVLSSWEFPDEYGQGVYMLRFDENSTGSWVYAPWYYVGEPLDGLPFYSLFSDSPYVLNWSAGVAMKLRVYTYFNHTLTGAGSISEGRNYLRHSVTVFSAAEMVFSQQNFTYIDSATIGDDIYYYEYHVILNFLPAFGTTYTVTVLYEIFW